MRVILLLIACICFSSYTNKVYGKKELSKKAVIVVTDLYHPYQDPGDNLDLIMGFALPQVELKAVILDITDAFRKQTADHPTLWKDPRGPREAGFIPVIQLNYIFNRHVPYAAGPFSPMDSEKDRMDNLPDFQQEGVDLLLNTLKSSTTPVDILSFGSARTIAVAYNRNPGIFKKKVNKIHISGGTASKGFELGKDQGANNIPGGEWNVALDVYAFTALLRSGLPINLYPCACKDGAFVKDVNNTYWKLENLDFITRMNPKLRAYIDFAFTKKLSYDFLRKMDDESLTIHVGEYPAPFHVWETAIWLNVCGLRVVKQPSGSYGLVDEKLVKEKDEVVSGFMQPCNLLVRDDGRFDFSPVPHPSAVSLYYRNNPVENERALQQIVPLLFESFHW